ncbi:hypothetical protein Angca_004271, partial [Angiostrongylus cantonensis]
EETMVSVWWSMAGIIQCKFLRPGETIMLENYCVEIEEIRNQNVHVQQLVWVSTKGTILLHDNARPQVSQMALRKLNEMRYETLPHSPYSSDLSSTDFHFFKRI